MFSANPFVLMSFTEQNPAMRWVCITSLTLIITGMYYHIGRRYFFWFKTQQFDQRWQTTRLVEQTDISKGNWLFLSFSLVCSDIWKEIKEPGNLDGEHPFIPAWAKNLSGCRWWLVYLHKCWSIFIKIPVQALFVLWNQRMLNFMLILLKQLWVLQLTLGRFFWKACRERIMGAATAQL